MGLTRSAADELRHIVNFVDFTPFVRIEEIATRPWASATLSGERHRLTLRLTGPEAVAEANAFLEGLAEREFPMRGHVLIDIVCLADERGEGEVLLTLEALTVEAD